MYSMSSAVASGSASPFSLATRDRVTMSPSAAGRSAVVRLPKRRRRTSSWSSTMPSATSSVSTSTEMPAGSGTSNSGRTSTSAVNSMRSPSSSLVTSTSGCASGVSWLAVTASP